MIEPYTEAQAREILEQYPSHPKTDRIKYMPDNPALIVPLVRQRWIDAAIIPASDELKATLLNKADAVHPRDISQCSVALKSKVSNGLPGSFSEPQVAHLERTHEFIRAAGCKDDEIRSFVFSYHPKSTSSFEPCLHVDLELNTYTALFGAPMEFYPGTVPEKYIGGLIIGCATWEEQKDFLRKNEICEDIEQELEGFGLGDIVVFGSRLVHRSSRMVANGPNHEGQGLVGYGLNPMNCPHPLFG